jgi:HEAT repeat protein
MNTLSFHTTGDDQPRPGIAVLHARFLSADQEVGKFFSVVRPLPPRPRNDGQLSPRLTPTNPVTTTKVDRIRANLRMPRVVMGVSADPAFVVGQGETGEDEIPDLKKNLQAADAVVRAGSAADLGSLGPKAAGAAESLAKLLDDGTPTVRTAAAAALLRINLREQRAMDVLSKDLESPDGAVRRQAARAVALAGRAAAPLATNLRKLLADTDVLTCRAALQAVAALGPDAAGTLDAVIPMLDKPETALDAADALGRMGPVARPAVKRLAKMLEAGAAAERWAALRAMAQIGGDDAAPAVPYIVRELRTASEPDSYNMLIFLALPGPVAHDAGPAVRTAQVKNQSLRQATLWAIDPDKGLPWLDGGPFGVVRPDDMVARWIYEAFAQELGDHLKPVAAVLARKIMEGSAGDAPPWGYKILARFPEESLAVLTPGLDSQQSVSRERAAVALGYMGAAGRPASAKVVEAIEKAPGEKEKCLLKWCLREIEQAKYT